MKSAFTLAEILIALVLIGILTAILLPVAFHAAPDEDVMKFKKANNTLATVIRELVTSDKYYKDGDLGIRANGELINGEHEGDIKYFCLSFADMISAKKVNCSEVKNGDNSSENSPARLGYVTDRHILEDIQSYADTYCKENTSAGEEIVTIDGVVFYQTSPYHTFGIEWDFYNNYDPDSTVENPHQRLFNASPDALWVKENGGFDPIYKPFCIDIDGINRGEDPFGYGIRADGKIMPGKRALEWINKSVQKGKD